MTLPFPSPSTPASGRAEVFLGYLEYFRETLLSKVFALSDNELLRSRLPSGWTPLELLKHLRYVELRWIEWGFEGSKIDEPWADWREDRWYVEPDETCDTLTASLRAQGRHTASVIASNDLETVGVPGPRWGGSAPATLERVLFHLVQEYARHLGHLDIVAELAGGPVGE